MSEGASLSRRRVHVEEHEEHVDERWLVSYADMMTLLFGLFVMLYSMQDPEAVRAMKESIEERFGSIEDPARTVASAVDVQSLNEELEKLKEVAKAKEEEVQQLLTAKLQAETLTNSLQAENEVLKKTSDKTEIIAALDKKKLEIELLQQEKLQANHELEEQKKLISSMQERLKEKEDKLNQAKEKIQASNTKAESVDHQKKEIEKMKADLAKAEIEKSKYESALKEIDRLKTELEKRTEKVNSGQFLAVVTSWSTPDHDLDLVVTDPNGQSFNFKKRSVANAPGKLVVDSRRGPGAEVWQADRIIPGRYKAEIGFYNQYGNTNPAEMKLVIFASGGNVELPLVKMDFNTSRKKVYFFEVDEKGKVRVTE